MPQIIRLLPLPFALLLIACDPPVDRAPARVPFEQSGSTYVWQLAHGRTGSLSLWRESGTGEGLPRIIMTCRSTVQGTLLVQGLEATAGESLSLTAGTETIGGAVAVSNRDGKPELRSDGPLPPRWFGALGEAEQVILRHAGQEWTILGPGREATEHYRRYCRTLDRRAASR